MNEWPADKVERRPVKDLVAHARNARTHSPEQIEQIAAAITEWGFANPVLVDEAGTIIAGHGRVLAARKLGLPEVPVMVARGWTDEQKRAYLIADNKITLNGGWDDSLLRVEFAELDASGFDLGKLGFTGPELAGIRDVRPAGLTDPEEAPEVPAVSVATRGDLWALGRHRLLCGDATDIEDVEELLDGAAPHLMVTDPPYGVNYDPSWRMDAAKKGLIGFAPSAMGTVANDSRIGWLAAWKLFPGEVSYIWHASAFGSEVQDTIRAADFEIRSQIIWAKSSFAISRGHYHWQHEACWYAVRKGKTGHWNGDRSQGTLWPIAHNKNETGHGTQKPIECMKRPIENNSKPGDSVYDPFLGSGTTIIAAEMTGRACLGIEIDPAYCDVSIQRWQNFTGEKALLNGKTFEEVKAERLGSDTFDISRSAPLSAPDGMS